MNRLVVLGEKWLNLHILNTKLNFSGYVSARWNSRFATATQHIKKMESFFLLSTPASLCAFGAVWAHNSRLRCTNKHLHCVLHLRCNDGFGAFAFQRFRQIWPTDRPDNFSYQISVHFDSPKCNKIWSEKSDIPGTILYCRLFGRGVWFSPKVQRTRDFLYHISYIWLDKLY